MIADILVSYAPMATALPFATGLHACGSAVRAVLRRRESLGTSGGMSSTAASGQWQARFQPSSRRREIAMDNLSSLLAALQAVADEAATVAGSGTSASSFKECIIHHRQTCKQTVSGDNMCPRRPRHPYDDHLFGEVVDLAVMSYACSANVPNTS